MLDFLLVLGQVPGTGFQITFYELLAGTLIIAAWIFRAPLRRISYAKKQQLTAWLKLKLWQRRQLSLPV